MWGVRDARSRDRLRWVTVLVLITVSAAIGVLALPAPASAVDPTPNPPIALQCGLDITLVLDASGSVQSSHAVEDVRSAAVAFLDALEDTGSTARVLQFGSIAQQLAARDVVTTASNDPNGAFGQAVAKYYNPIPPRPSGVTIRRFNGGSITSSGSWSTSNSSTQYTNWQQVLELTERDPGDLVVFITDGDPTAYNFTRPGDPSSFPATDVGVGTDSTSAAAASTLDRAIESANRVKAHDSRILSVGVGEALQNAASVARLTQVSGPVVADTVGEFDLATTDVALIADFGDLEEAIRNLVLELCSPSLTIRKFAQTDSDATYQPAGGWDITVTPTVDGGTFEWILPQSATGPSQTLPTNSQGFAQFQWEPDPAEATSSALVEEQLEDDYTAGRPDDDDFVCQAKDEDGNVRNITGELDVAGDQASFTIDPIAAEIVTCALYNSFDYEPGIQLEKVNDPTEVRGGLRPPATVTSTYTVTNTGNTPLSDLTGFDDQCGLVVPELDGGDNVGDVDNDGVFDPGEAWIFTCEREIGVSRAFLGAVNIVNNATVQGTDPTGTVVTDDAFDDVDVFVPEIELTKLVNGQSAVTVTSGDDVTYTYRAENTGDTPLSPVTLEDDQLPCETPDRDPDEVGNNDDVMDLGEVWLYSCTTPITDPVVNTAVVRGTPLNPATDAPFSEPNPEVTDQDSATVNVVEPGLTLTKGVDESLVFPGTGVTYTYDATNTGSSDLRNDTGDPDWVTDDTCPGVQQVLLGGFNAGDANGDGLLNPGETWQFTCDTTIDEDTVNTATIIAQPVSAGVPVGQALERTARALVEIVTADIALTKVALVGVVLDPDAEPVSGPDVPDPRPAQYLYQVTNTGDVPIQDVDLTDDRCADVTVVSGDEGEAGVLEVGEVWNYLCSTTLEREQGTPPPVDESGLVTNTADVAGTPFLPDDPDTTGPDVTARDTAQVLVIEPGIQLTKTASAETVLVGTEVTYTIRVTNTGDVGLKVIGPVDDKCTDLVLVDDGNGNDILEGANAPDLETGDPETWIYTCTRDIGLPLDPDTADTNEATVQGIDPLGNLYEDSDDATVQVIDPDIALEKTVSETLVPAGTPVTYQFRVTNAGRSPVAANDVLAQVDLGDVAVPSTPDCTEPELVSKTGGNDDDLLERVPFETWTYACSATIEETTNNLAVVSALGGTQFDDPDLVVEVFDLSAARVQVFHPGLEVEKTADPTRLPDGGGEVTYTYRVRNTGDVPLAGVAERITDDTCSPVEYVRGDTDGDGLLDTPTSIFEDSADETWVFTCTTSLVETTTNIVVSTGTPTDPAGVALCGPESTPELEELGVVDGRVLEPCDVDARDRARVVVGGLGPLGPDDENAGTGGLPDTGSNIPWQLPLLGLLMLIAGSWLIWRARRDPVPA